MELSGSICTALYDTLVVLVYLGSTTVHCKYHTFPSGITVLYEIWLTTKARQRYGTVLERYPGKPAGSSNTVPGTRTFIRMYSREEK